MSEFRINTIKLNVLSEGSIEGREISQIINDTDSGDLVLATVDMESAKVDGKTMAKWLRMANSDPGFFMLDDDGNQVED
jgi:hypothetical protein